MAKYVCPICGGQLPNDQLNQAEGIALCPSCQSVTPMSELVVEGELESRALNLPDRCRIKRTPEAIEIYSSQRSIWAGIMFTGMSLFWNGLLAGFLIFTFYSFAVHVNSDGREAATQLEEAGKLMPLDEIPTTLIFFIPFIAGGIFFLSAALFNLFGRIDIRIRPYKAEVSTGFWRLRIRRQFDPKNVRSVTIKKFRNSYTYRAEVVINAAQPVRFGLNLHKSQCEWLRAVLHVLLVTPDTELYDELLKQAEAR